MELERKKKEIEERKRLEEEKKDELRPKSYTKEELDAYHKLNDEICNIFTAHVMKQM